jgi:hypothetical protein
MTTAKTMAADDEDNEVDGDSATGDGATGDYGDDDDYGDGRWTTTTNEVDVDGDGATGGVVINRPS